MANMVAGRRSESVPQVSSPPGSAGTPHVRRAALWFVLYNVIAFGVMAGLYLLVFHGEFMNPFFQATYHYFDQHQTQAVLAAAMPFFASLLVGFGYARRAARRKQRELDDRMRQSAIAADSAKDTY